jgi:hypothetical protein
MVRRQFPPPAIFVDGETVCGRNMPPEHLTAPTAFQADDKIPLDGSSDRNRRGALGHDFRRVAESTERFVNRRDQRRHLVDLNFIMSGVRRDDLRREASINDAVRRSLGIEGPPVSGHNIPPRQTEEVIEDSPHLYVAPSTSFWFRHRPKRPHPLSLTRVDQEVWSLPDYKIFSDYIK